MNSRATIRKIALVVLVAGAAALAAYLGVRGDGASGGAGADAAAVAERKRAFEAARARGNLSFHEAKYWRPATAAGAPGP
jgi:hypothetical protein